MDFFQKVHVYVCTYACAFPKQLILVLTLLLFKNFLDNSLANIVVDFIQLQIEKSEMSGPIEKIVDTGIGSDYNSGQVYCFKC